MRESERNECGATNKENGVSSSRQTGEQRTAIRACSSFIRSMLGPMNFSFTILNIGFLGCWWFLRGCLAGSQPESTNAYMEVTAHQRQ